ncbi:hypothetical protein HDE68_003793 [Pedobacter cryoconitis]|uniref:Uncharacterized protein n=1 Tax=Pedobacter cryoconitis TaxID=188932 RepID=A0A7W9E0B5_9SPHI|nr:hypothetical protein [Pedobacter cryoconitis]MBB5637868.1 hypothetical protein [Pedobacter cryoconitis]
MKKLLGTVEAAKELRLSVKEPVDLQASTGNLHTDHLFLLQKTQK